MKIRRSLVAVATIALLTACSTQAEAKSPAAPQELPLTAHVIDATALPGFSADGDPVRLTLAEFAEQHDKTVPELEAIGMTAAAGLEFAPEGDAPGMAMSVAMQFKSTAATTKEADRLFASNSEAEDGTTVTPVDVPGVPGARAVQLDGEMEGQAVRGLEVVFVDGKVLHELFAFTLSSAISVDDLIAAVTALYEDVKGTKVAS